MMRKLTHAQRFLRILIYTYIEYIALMLGLYLFQPGFKLARTTNPREYANCESSPQKRKKIRCGNRILSLLLGALLLSSANLGSSISMEICWQKKGSSEVTSNYNVFVQRKDLLNEVGAIGYARSYLFAFGRMWNLTYAFLFR